MGCLQNNVNHVELMLKKPVGQFLKKGWATEYCGLPFNELFLNTTGAVIVQSILICCVLKQQDTLFTGFLLVGCQKVQIL